VTRRRSFAGKGPKALVELKTKIVMGQRLGFSRIAPEKGEGQWKLNTKVPRRSRKNSRRGGRSLLNHLGSREKFTPSNHQPGRTKVRGRIPGWGNHTGWGTVARKTRRKGGGGGRERAGERGNSKKLKEREKGGGKEGAKGIPPGVTSGRRVKSNRKLRKVDRER